MKPHPGRLKSSEELPIKVSTANFCLVDFDNLGRIIIRYPLKTYEKHEAINLAVWLLRKATIGQDRLAIIQKMLAETDKLMEIGTTDKD